MANGNSGTKIKDYDGATSGVLGATAAVNTAGGAALLAMSSTFHVVLGSILLAWGIFLFYWVQSRRVSHERLLTVLGYDRDRVREILSRAHSGE